jgi:uncharacterized repeat protein (TIGR03803 family)
MRNKRFFLGFPAVLAAMVVSPMVTAPRLAAQTETVLYDFNPQADRKGPQNPSLGLVFDAAGNLYGTTQYGGTSNAYSGEVFELSPTDGGSWTKKSVHAFNGRDGNVPRGSLTIDASGHLYGATYYGGSPNFGVVYELIQSKTGTWGEKILHNFGNSQDGQYPWGGLVFDAAGNLYGTAWHGGANGTGMVFELTPQSDGSWSEAVLYNFGTGSDAQYPAAGVIFGSNGNLYGTTLLGGTADGGTAYELSPQPDGGWRETVLHSFKRDSVPSASLVFDKYGNLYGTTGEGGAHGWGSVFELSPPVGDGPWSERNLLNFGIEAQGFHAFSSLVFDTAGNLYGATLGGGAYGGPDGRGMVFKLTPIAGGNWEETVLFSFDITDGSEPGFGGLTFDAAGNLYGTTQLGGAYGGGTVFKIVP